MVTGEITLLLIKLRDGDRHALNTLFEQVHRELRVIARAQVRRQRGGPHVTLNATALINEAYIKLVDRDVAWNDRKHFFSVAAMAMRQIQVNHAREKMARKRGGGAHITALDESRIGSSDRLDEILAIDEALDKLSTLSERLVKVVELRYFGAMSVDEVADVLGVDPRTVKRDWRKARAFLTRELTGREPDSPGPP